MMGPFWMGVLVGTVLGVFAGVTILACCVAARRADDETGRIADE